MLWTLTNLDLNMGILRMLRNGGMGVLMSSHILGSVDELADEVWFIKEGSLLQEAVTGPNVRARYRELYG